MLTQTMINHGTSRRPVAITRPAAPVASHTGTIEMMGAPMPFARNAEIYGENEPAEYLYKVVSGAVRTYKVLNDGRRQIGAFYLPGDIFGLEVGDMHTFSAEAIVASKVLVIKRSVLVTLAARDNEVARKLWTMTAEELQRVQAHILLLIKTAQEKCQSATKSICQCHVRTSPTISASPSKRSRVPSPSLRTPRPLRCRPPAASCCVIVRRSIV